MIANRIVLRLLRIKISKYSYCQYVFSCRLRWMGQLNNLCARHQMNWHIYIWLLPFCCCNCNLNSLLLFVHSKWLLKFVCHQSNCDFRLFFWQKKTPTKPIYLNIHAGIEIKNWCFRFLSFLSFVRSSFDTQNHSLIALARNCSRFLWVQKSLFAHFSFFDFR